MNSFTSWRQNRARRKRASRIIGALVRFDLDETARADAVARELEEAGPEAVDVLLEAARITPLSRRRLAATVAVYAAAALPWLVLSMSLMRTWLVHLPPTLGFAISQAIALSLTLAWFARRQRTRLAELLARFDDARLVGPLAEALPFTKGKAREAVEGKLAQILGRVGPDDAERFTRDQRGALYRSLQSENVELVTAILGALARIEDTDALPHVERLSAGHGPGRYKKIRESAIKVCFTLIDAADRRRERMGLLRAADPPVDSLLRPAAADETAQKLLLRAADSADDGEG